MAAKHWENGEIAQRRAEVARRRLRGQTQQQVGDAMGISQQTVSNDLQALELEWRESAKRDFETARAIKLAEFAEVKRLAWEMIERLENSCNQQTQGALAAAGTKAGKRNSCKGEAKVEVLDSRTSKLMSIVLQCMDREVKLEGLDARAAQAPGPDSKEQHQGLDTKQIVDRLSSIVFGVGSQDQASNHKGVLVDEPPMVQ